MRVAFFMLLAVSAGQALAAEAMPGCLPAVAVPLTVSINGAERVAATLEGGIEMPISLIEATSRRVLWSAGARAAAVQHFPAMTSAFFGSLAAIDLDADGLHDRIYAGDVAGRVWRFDIHHGAPAAQWTSGGIFADFTNHEGRGFLAAPDVSLSAPPGTPPWLNIAIGTAAPGNARANNRLYALRDHAAYDAWTDEEYEDWQPLRETDLARVDATVQSAADAVAFAQAGHPGWYMQLGSGHVVSPAITVNHRVVLAIAAAVPRSGACEVLTRITTFELQPQPGQPVARDNSNSRTTLAQPVPVAARFTHAAPRDGTATCLLAGQHIAACDVDSRPRKTWWRRADAE